MTHPHLLYPDVSLYRARIQIRLYRYNELVAVFAADSLTQEQLETGVLCRACDHACCSMVTHTVLRHYHAIAEVEDVQIRVGYSSAQLEFYVNELG